MVRVKSDRLLVIGGTGMLGHRLVLEAMTTVDTWWTVRASGNSASQRLGMSVDRQIQNVDITDIAAVRKAVVDVAPTVVINCAGTVKQRVSTGKPEMIRTNSIFPHELAEVCDQVGARLVHLSTDCVFSGVPGDRPHGYSIDDTPDAVDLYGRSKLLGEVSHSPHLTVRIVAIGPELSQHSGLLDWFRFAPEPIAGYRNALFTGFTTLALARILIRFGFEHGNIYGTHHLAGPTIDKYSLLVMLRDRLRPDVTIVPDESVNVDRRLDGRHLAGLANLHTPSWDDMLDELADQMHKYSREK